MPPFDRKQILEALKIELSIIEGGGYGRSVKTPWRETNLFRDSITCLNVGETVKSHSCAECFLIEHVPASHQDDDVPCHHIPLNEKGETIDGLDRQGRREEVEHALREWIKSTIAKLEQQSD